jgi:hypothetical protein
MTERSVGFGDAAAILVVSGVVIIALPTHALSVVQLAVVAVAMLACGFALTALVPPAGWVAPFKAMSPFGRRSGVDAGDAGSDEIRTIRSRLSGWRQPIAHGPALPPETLLHLRPLIRTALHLDPDDESQWTSAARRVSPLTWAVLTSDSEGQTSRFWLHPPNSRHVAEAVHKVLDEIERISAGAHHPDTSIDHNRLGAP